MIGVTDSCEEVLVRLVGDSVAEDVEMTVVGNGTTEDSPEVGRAVIIDPLVDGVKDEDTSETDIVDEATGIEEPVKITTDEELEVNPETVLLWEAELAPGAKTAPEGASFADEV